MKIHELIQGSEEWAAFRLNHHGASEAAAMLGLSRNVSRTELMRQKKTGTAREFSAWVQKNILDRGHEVEALARPLVEEIIGDDLYPVTCSNEDEGGNLSASCDGLTMLGDTAFEHKQWNEEYAELVKAGTVPEEHMPQCQQILLITGAKRVVFTISDGTPARLVHTEVTPDAGWFERIRAGWAQFDHDLEAYVDPSPAPAVVAGPVEHLPSVHVQVSGQIDVRENFKAFESALRDFLDNKLIREPQTDQDFADLDLQIKAMKKAEETLNAAEAMMLAQIQSVDEAKRQKDMLAKVVRDNRLMAEKLLASEKDRRKTERIVAAREAFTKHVSALQQEIKGVRLELAQPDFAGVIKGLKTLQSIQDKLDTALANAKIAADQAAADLRTKLGWVEAYAADHRGLLADMQQLAAKPIDDFKLAISSRIEAHKKAEAARLEAERERIRQEEAERLERQAREQQAKETTPAAAQQRSDDARAMVASLVQRVATVEVADPLPRGSDPTLRLGQINERLSPISLTADGLAALGFPHAATDKAAKLYHERDFPRICATLVRHIESAAVAA